MPSKVADTTTRAAIAQGGYHERLQTHYDSLAPAEQRVADQLLELGPAGLVLSAAALGQRLGTSDATIVRTAKALGYRTLSDLRADLANSTVAVAPDTRLRRTLQHAEPDDLLTTFASEQVAALEALAANIGRDEFRLAAELLSRAQRVVWRGVGPSAHIAGYGELLTARIGKRSASLVHTGTSFADELIGVMPGDAIVLLAYGPIQSHVTVLLDRANEMALPVVLVTDTLGRKLAKRVDVVLRSGRGRPGEFASHSATLVLVEALTLATAARDRSAAASTLHDLNELRAAIIGRRLDVDA
jgi:DNA-binding MurR/RpiR family transcriptional regulator